MCRECRRSESQKRQQADENLHVSSQSTNFCVDDYYSQQLFCQPILNQTRHTGTPSRIAVLWPTLSHGERRTPRDGERPSSRQYTRRAVLVNAESATAGRPAGEFRYDRQQYHRQKVPAITTRIRVPRAFRRLQVLDIPDLTYFSVLEPKVLTVTAEANMDPAFDIFKLLPDGPLRVMAVQGLEQANEQMARLVQTSPGEYFIRSHQQMVELEQPEEWAEVT